MMSKSFLSVIGWQEVDRMLENAVKKAAARNKAAGVTTASSINGRLVITPGTKERSKARPRTTQQSVD